MSNEEHRPSSQHDGTEILDALEEELDSRLERQPSAKDRLAIRTALAKAIARGRNMTTSPESELPEIGEVDFWAERYPDRTGEEPAEGSPDVGPAIRDLADALGNAVASAAHQLAKALRGPGER
jgi:hypothetical protein